MQNLLSLCMTQSGFLSSTWAPWGRETAERGCFSLLIAYSAWGTATLLMLQPKQPPTLVSGVMGYVQWGTVTECASQGLCVRLCHGTLSIVPSRKLSWAHLFKRLPLSSVGRPCCCQQKGYTNSLEASRDRRIRDTTTLNFLWIHSSGASPTPQVYYRNCELFTDITVSWIQSLASLLLKLIQFIKVQFTRGSSLNWDESHGTSLSPLLFFPLRGMPSKCLTWSP